MKMPSHEVYNIKDSMGDLASFIQDNVAVIDRFDMGYGVCGFAIFYHQRYLLYGHQEDLQAFYEMTERAIYLANNPVENGFTYIDYTEMGFFLRGHIPLLQKKFDVAEMIQQIDELLLDYASYAIGQYRLDPYTGGMLQAHYFLLQGIHTGFIADLVNDFFTTKLSLESTEISQTGITHGLAFFLLFFVRCFEQGIQTEKSLHLIRHLCDALMGAEQDADIHGSFFCDRRQEAGVSGLNLCYGDAGIVYALLRASKYLLPGYAAAKTDKMVKHLINRIGQVSPAGTDSILYGESGHLFYLQHLQNEGFLPHLPATDTLPSLDVTWNLRENLHMYGLREKKKISLLEGATGVAYLHCCRQTGANPRYINALTYLL